MQELIETFQAVSDGGQAVSINVYQNYVIERTKYDGDIKLLGLKELRTDDGTFVRIDDDDDNVFHIQGLLKVTRIP